MTTEATDLRTPGTTCWPSLLAHRADQAQDFYRALFGWDFVPGPRQPGSYAFAELNGRRVAGLGEGPPDTHRPVSWTTMLAVDDVDHAAELVREYGGTVGVGPLNIGEDGRAALAVDPSGAVFGLWQGGPLGGAAGGEPGTVVWSELITHGSVLVEKFYEAVFGCDLEHPQDIPRSGEDRVLLSVDGCRVADIHGLGQDLPRERGAHWMTYFAVADTDAATLRTAELGGRVISPPHATPYGRRATVADPEGAVFSLITPA